jgi:hypothetical protein
MQPGECLRRVGPLVRECLPDDLCTFRYESISFQSKLWYGNKDLHYEIWSRERLGTIEIGLHFEADPLTNARLLAAFTANAKAIRRELADARIEDWDRGWARIWEPLPHRQPDESLARELAERVAAYITMLEPILRRELPSDVAWSEPTGRRSPSKAGRSKAARSKAAAPSRASRSSR